MAMPRFLIVAAQGSIRALCAPSAFIPTVTESLLIRTSHPFGSRHLGFPAGGRYPAPGCWQPQKFLGSLPWPSDFKHASAQLLQGDGRGMSIPGAVADCSALSQFAGSGPRAGPTPCWFHDRGASVPSRRSTVLTGCDGGQISSAGCRPTP